MSFYGPFTAFLPEQRNPIEGAQGEKWPTSRLLTRSFSKTKQVARGEREGICTEKHVGVGKVACPRPCERDGMKGPYKGHHTLQAVCRR